MSDEPEPANCSIEPDETSFPPESPHPGKQSKPTGRIIVVSAGAALLFAAAAAWYFTGPGLKGAAESWLSMKSGLRASIGSAGFSRSASILFLKDITLSAPSSPEADTRTGKGANTGTPGSDADSGIARAKKRAYAAAAQIDIRPAGFFGIGRPFSGATVEGFKMSARAGGRPVILGFGDSLRVDAGISVAEPLSLQVLSGFLELTGDDAEGIVLLKIPGATMSLARADARAVLLIAGESARVHGLPFTLDKPFFKAVSSTPGIVDNADIGAEVSGMRVQVSFGKGDETEGPAAVSVTLEKIQTKWAAGILSLGRMFYALPGWVAEAGRILSCPQIDGNLNLEVRLSGRPSGGFGGFEGWFKAAREIALLKQSEARLGRFAAAAHEFDFSARVGLGWTSNLWEEAAATFAVKGGTQALNLLMAVLSDPQSPDGLKFEPLPAGWETTRACFQGVPAFGLENIIAWIAEGHADYRRLRVNGSALPVSMQAELRGPASDGRKGLVPLEGPGVKESAPAPVPAAGGNASISWEGLSTAALAEWTGLEEGVSLTGEAMNPNHGTSGRANIVWPGPRITISEL